MRGDSPRSTAQEVTTAAGISAAAAGLVGAVALVGRLRRPQPAAPSGGAQQEGPGGSARDARRQAAKAPAPDADFKPEGPEDLHRPTLVYSLKSTLREFGSDQCTDIAASLVYYSVLALGPGLLAVISILGLLSPSTVSDLTGQVLAPVETSSPQVYQLLNGLITTLSGTPAPGLGLAIGIVGALWSASGYVGAFGRAMNRVYSIPEGRPVWILRPTQLAVTVVLVLLVVIGALLLVSTGPIVEQLADGLGVGAVAFTVFQIVKWPVLVAIAIAAVAILYYFSPNIRQPKFKWTSTGSVLALVVWAVATVGFGLYLAFSGGSSYSRSYGPVAGVIIFLLWLWITNLALLFGAEFDAELERSRELQAGIAAEEQIQLPPRDTRQSDKKAEKHEQAVAGARRLRESRGRED